MFRLKADFKSSKIIVNDDRTGCEGVRVGGVRHTLLRESRPPAKTQPDRRPKAVRLLDPGKARCRESRQNMRLQLDRNTPTILWIPRRRPAIRAMADPGATENCRIGRYGTEDSRYQRIVRALVHVQGFHRVRTANPREKAADGRA